MKLRHLILPSLAFFAVSANAQTIVIYDTITSATGATNPVSFTGTLPRHHMADGFSTLTAPPAMWWRVTRAEVVLVVGAAGTFANSTARLQFYNDWNHVSTATPVFGGLASDTTWSLGTVSATGASAFIYTMDFAANNLAFDLVDGQSIGLAVTWLVGGLRNDNLTLGVTDAAPVVGSSTNLFYRDVDDDGIIEGNEARFFTNWTNTNAMYRIHAEAVPEPATLLILGAGAAALAARRRRKK